jgi:hypothetical protein
MIVLDVAGVVLVLIGLVLLVLMRSTHSISRALGVEIRGPAGLVVIIAGVVCLVLGNVDTGKASRDGESPRPVVDTTPAVPLLNSSSVNRGPAVFPGEFGGTWTGVYKQSDGQSYRMELVITANTSAGQVRYPSLGCFGTVTATSRSDQSVRAQESILNGRCTPTGTMMIELRSNGQLSITYVPDGATYTADAILVRSP